MVSIGTVVTFSIYHRMSPHLSTRCTANLDVIIVRKEGAVDSHKDFRVRRSVVLMALQWLVQNNIYYHDVTIDHSVLALLPVDGELTTNLRTMRVSSMHR